MRSVAVLKSFFDRILAPHGLQHDTIGTPPTPDAKPPASRDTGPHEAIEGLQLHCADVCVMGHAHANLAALGVCCGVLCWVWEQVGC